MQPFEISLNAEWPISAKLGSLRAAVVHNNFFLSDK